jgi:hypothetical protein
MKDESCWKDVEEVVKQVKEHAKATGTVIPAKNWTLAPGAWYRRFTRKLPAESLKTIMKY